MVDAYKSGASALSLARRHRCSIQTVLRRLTERGVDIRRTGREPAVRLGLTQGRREYLAEVIDGLMLGDGSMDKQGSLRLSQTSRRAEWVYEISSKLSWLGIYNKVIDVPKSKGAAIGGRIVHGGPSKMLYTLICDEFKRERMRWYPDGKKRVPSDVRTTPLSVGLWFCGDGTYATTGTLQFCTNGFSPAEVGRLAGRLSSIVGIHAVVRSSDGLPIIRINRRDDAHRLQKFMGRHVSKCFAYKLQHVRRAIPKGRVLRRLTMAQVRRMRGSYARGVTSGPLSLRYGVSRVTVCKIVKHQLYREVA